MATITIRVDDDTRRALDEIAASQGVSMSDLVRFKIDELLGRSPELDMSSHPVSLTPVQRALLAQNQEILAAVCTDEYERGGHQSLATIIREGFTSEYYRIFQDIGGELSPEHCRLVMDILEMFRICGDAVDSLSDEDRAALGHDATVHLTFGGFDGNDELEGHMRSYVEHLVGTHRWQEVAPLIDARHDFGNSHYPALPGYRRMLDRYRAVMQKRRQQSRVIGRETFALTSEELRYIAL